MELGSLPFCSGSGGGTTGLSVVNVRAGSASLDSSHSPQNLHLIASRRICCLQNGHTLNALCSIASILPGPYSLVDSKVYVPNASPRYLGCAAWLAAANATQRKIATVSRFMFAERSRLESAHS